MKIKIVGIEPYDGEYEFDLNFTLRELHTIKRVSGVREGELLEAIQAGDSDLVVAFATVALQRVGQYVDEDLFWDAPPTAKLTLVTEDDAGPPDLSTPSGPGSNGESTPSSGAPSDSGSENPGSDPSPTGDQT